jgi:endonuclease-3 related protein
MKIPTHLLREQLLSLDGLGPETADDILLYALDRPVFVVDEYTRRISVAEQISSVTSYNTLQELFSSAIRKDFRTYQDFHALIVINGKAGR